MLKKIEPMDLSRLLVKIADLTENNAHNESLLVVFEFFQLKIEADIIKHIMAIHKIVNSMPSDLISYRNSLTDRALNTIGKLYSNDIKLMLLAVL